VKLAYSELQGALEDFLLRYMKPATRVVDAEFERLSAIGQHADPELLQQMTVSLANPNPAIVKQACVALAAAKYTAAVPMLLTRLGEGNMLTGPALVWCLGEIGERSAVRPLEGVFARGAYQEDVIEAWVKLGDCDPLPYLATALVDGETRIRLYAAGAMSQLLSTLADRSEWAGLAPRLEGALSDIFPPVRILAAGALALLGRAFSSAELKLLVEATLKTEQLSPLEAFFTRR
jgi:HEAT repeat protein